MCRQCFIAFYKKGKPTLFNQTLKIFPFSASQLHPQISPEAVLGELSSNNINNNIFIPHLTYRLKFPCHHHIWTVFAKQAAGMKSEQSYCCSSEGSILERETESVPAPQVMLSACTPFKRQSRTIISPSNMRIYTL